MITTTRKTGKSVLSGLAALQQVGKTLENNVQSFDPSTSEAPAIVSPEKGVPEIPMINKSSEILEKAKVQQIVTKKLTYESVRVSTDHHRAIKIAATIDGITVTDYLYKILEDYLFQNNLKQTSLNGKN